MFAADWQQEFNLLEASSEHYLVNALEALSQLNPQVLENKQQVKVFVTQLIVAIDQTLSQQLSEIIAQPEFVELEALWRNLHSLVTLNTSVSKVKIKLLDRTWAEVARDLNASISIERTLLYNMIGNRQLNTLGGEPFGLFVVNHAISMEMKYDDEFDDLYTLELLARLGELCLCPFTLSISDGFFGHTGVSWLTDTGRIQKIIDGPDFNGWRRLRQHPAMKFIALTMPKVKLRPRYAQRRIGFIFDENKNAEQGLWGSSAFAFAGTAMAEFSRLSWFGFMKSRWKDKYQGALINTKPGINADFVHRQPQPDIHFTSAHARFYMAQGLIAITRSSMTDKYYFLGNASLWLPDQGKEDSVGSQIQAMLMSCRIAHYLKVQIRNMIGGFQTAMECQTYLSHWIDEYSSNLVDADEHTLSKYPLRRGTVKVRELEDNGTARFVCELTIEPQYQSDHFCGEIMLSTDLGVSKREER